MRFHKWLLTGAIAMMLLGCSGPSVETYEGTEPRFDVRQYFNGMHEGHGILRDWSGKVTRRFHFTMKGAFDDKGGSVHEEFVFDDGEKQSREWKFAMKDDHHFSGSASDGVGAAEGKQYGSAVQLRYTLKVKVDGKDMNIDFDDWMFLQPGGRAVVNETKLRKFGLTVGRLTIFIGKKA